MTLSPLSNLFLLLTATMAVTIILLFSRYLDGRVRTGAIAVFVGWLIYAGILGERGVIAMRSPPGPAFLLLPVVLFVMLFLVRNRGVEEFAMRVPGEWLIGLQGFRVFVELALYGLSLDHLVPRLMTFEGGNLDIFIGLSAPFVAVLFAKRRISETAVRVWNIVGIVMLANIVVRTLLTFSGTIRTDIPTLGIGIFPFTYLPGFLAPLALCLHILFLRSLRGRHRLELATR